MRKVRIVLTGGGSGGHIYPLLAVAESLERLAVDANVRLELFYVGPQDSWSEFVSRRGINVRTVAGAKLRRYNFGLLHNILDVPKFFFSIFQAFFKIFWIMPEAIFSKGGPGALPVILAGWFYRIPILIHESDAVPGLTNLISARFARRIAVSFERSAKYFPLQKTAVTGTPVRKEVTAINIPTERAKSELRFDPQKPLILVLGGSQGAQPLNEFLLINLPALARETQILHQTGAANFAEVKKLAQAALLDVPAAEQLRYEAVPYITEDMGTAFRAADIVVSRAGSGSIFEIAAAGKPALLIPLLGAASDHQRANAYEYAKTGAAVIIEEDNLLPGIFLNQLKQLLNDPVARSGMSKAAESFYRPEASKTIAGEILNLA